MVTLNRRVDAIATSCLFEKFPLKIKPSSGWRLHRSRGNRRPPSNRSALLLVGHLLLTAFLYTVILVLTWCVTQCAEWLNNVHPLPEDAFRFLSQLKLAILYGETTLFAYFWLTGTWYLLKEMKR